MSEQALAQLCGITKEYRVRDHHNPFRKQSLRAVNDLTLAVQPGEILGLVGESGCGKSTAGQLLAGLLQPTAGQLCYRGQPVKGFSRAQKQAMRREIQIILQDPYASLNPSRKIGWLLQEPLKINTALPAAQRRARVGQMMQTVGLDESYLNAYPHELSGGQRQRVNIAAALMLQPTLLVADEAVSALDVSIQSQILNLLLQLKKANHLTYLFISHDLNVVEYMSDHIGVMYLGQLVEYGDVETVYRHALHPYTQALLSAVPTVNEVPRQHIVLQGEVPSLLCPPTGCAFCTRCNKAKPICMQTPAPLVEVTPGHSVRCHFAAQ
ncbi:MAG: hypothetical protein PWQ08_1191 [Clostridiales bacterium]|nr:hypothetical protein [Clostridiales bacterium]